MAFDQDQIDELKSCYPNLGAVEDGEKSFILISPLPLPVGCVPQVVDGLLCPFLRDGYPSRLFLSAKITHKGQGQNWNADGVMIAGRKWWAVSWNPLKNKQPNQDVNQRLIGMVTAHLQAFQ
jgi:hypothetical protein